MTASRLAQPCATQRATRTAALRLLAVTALASGLGGCGVLNTLQDGNLVAAAPLCEDISDTAVAKGATCHTTPPSSADDMKERLGDVINESEHNCERFVNGLVLASTSTNTGLDGLTTLFTGLGTAFTPLGTVHALTAAGSVSSGWKTAIDADVYAKANIANYAQAINTSYYTDLHNYLEDLKTSDPGKMTWSIELGKIRTIHKECSLASAQQVISATVQPPSGTGGGGTTPGGETTGGASGIPGPRANTSASTSGTSGKATGTAGRTGSSATATAGAATGALTGGVTTRSVIPGHAVR